MLRKGWKKGGMVGHKVVIKGCSLVGKQEGR